MQDKCKARGFNPVKKGNGRLNVIGKEIFKQIAPIFFSGQLSKRFSKSAILYPFDYPIPYLDIKVVKLSSMKNNL